MRRASALRWWVSCAEFCNEACLGDDFAHVRDRLDFAVGGVNRILQRAYVGAFGHAGQSASGRRKGCSRLFDNGFGQGRGFRSGFRGGFYVAFDHAAVRARSGQRGSVDGFFFCQRFGARGYRRHCPRRSCRRRCRRCGRCRFYFGGRYRGRCRRRRNFCCGNCATRTEFVGGFAFVADHHYVGQHRYFIAVVEKNVQNRSGYLGFFLERGFVRFIGEKDVSHRYGVAFFLFHFGQDTAFYGLSLLRHDNYCCHNLGLSMLVLNCSFWKIIAKLQQ